MVAVERELSHTAADRIAVSLAGGLTIRLFSDLTMAEAAWRKLETNAVGSPFQRFDFVAAWMRQIGQSMGAEPLVICGERDDATTFVLPLVVIRKGPFKIAQFAGGPHATSNFGLFAPSVWPEFSAADVTAIYRAIAEERPDVHLVYFWGQPEEIAGRKNPFVDDRSYLAPHHAYDLSLDGGFDAVLSRHRGAKKRKKLRAVSRDFDRIGGYRFIQADNIEDARRILDAFFIQKAARFAAMNIPNVFACPKTREFFYDMVEHSYSGNGRAIDCYAVEAEGKIRATSIGAPFAGTQYYVMNSFAADEFARSSPGEIAVFHFIEACCAAGFDHFNFGIGDARYKRSWCDRELQHFETLVPLGMMGLAAASFLKGKRRLRDFIVARPGLMRTVQTLRRRRMEGDDEGGPSED